MADPTQETFLGATIRYFNCNVGWGNETTTVNIGLVEDERNGDRFSNPLLHSLAFFNYGTWQYWGILTNIDEKVGNDGNRVFDVVLSDPRQFLDGVQLILGGYNQGVFNVPNLYNIYGYLEQQSFGYSQRNDAGIPWRKVAEGLNALINTVPITNRGYQYSIDLSTLPSIDDSYRISQENISLLEFINEICEIANHEYIVELQSNIIKFVTVNRNQEYRPGSIKQYLSSKAGYSSANSSLQAEFNTINKFIVGAQVEELKYQFYNDGNDPNLTEVDNTIGNFWGLDRFGNVILPNNREEYDDYSVTVEGFAITDVRYVTNPITAPLNGPQFDTKYRDFTMGYTFSIGELRAAMISREAWEGYIQLHDYSLPEGSTLPRSVHEGKSVKLGLRSEVNNGVALDILFNNRALNDISPAEISALRSAKVVDNFNDREEYISRVYAFVKDYADNYYGKKFMIRTPFVLAHYNEFGDLETSYEPSESGYVEESMVLQSIALNLMPLDTTIITDSDRKITPYVRYTADNIKFNLDGTVDLQGEGINISSIPFGSYYIGNSIEIDDGDPNTPPSDNIIINSIFIRCDIDPKLVFVNKATATNPRAVITMPGPVSNVGNKGYDPAFAFRSILQRRGLAADEIDRQVRLFQAKAGADNLVYGGGALHIGPEFAAIPLRDNTRTYGPWYTQNGQGKVEFEKNTELAPWNFGGYQGMNLAGQTLVSNMSEARFIGEGGSIEFEGFPDILPGRSILANGPIISNISVSMGDAGVVTRYTLGRWDSKHGRNNARVVEQQKKLYDNKKEILKLKKESNKPQPPIINLQNLKLADKASNIFPRRRVSNSSSNILIGNLSQSSSGTEFESEVAAMPMYTSLDNIREENWVQKAGMSMDGMFRPFSTKTDASGIAHYESSSSLDINVDNLNPFRQGHDFQVLFHGETIPEELSKKTFEPGDNKDYRALALRGPLVITGWGYDTEGKPVPSVIDDPVNSGVVPSGQSDADFMSGYLQRSDQWKTGPVDLRWDRDRKLWSSIIREKVTVISGPEAPGLRYDGDDIFVSSTSCSEVDIISGQLIETGAYGTLHNVNQAILPPNSVCVVHKKGDNEYIYCEGGKVVRDIVTSIGLFGNSLVATVTPSYVYQYSGLEYQITIGGSGCP